jgi:hypothetical protein
MCVRMVPFPTEPEEACRPFAGESRYESDGDPSDTGDQGGRTTDTCLLPGMASLVGDGDGTVRVRGAAPDRLPSGPRRGRVGAPWSRIPCGYQEPSTRV